MSLIESCTNITVSENEKPALFSLVEEIQASTVIQSPFNHSQEKDTVNERTELAHQKMSPNSKLPTEASDQPSGVTSTSSLEVNRRESYTEGSIPEDSPISSPTASYTGESKSAEPNADVDLSSPSSKGSSSYKGNNEEKCISDQEGADFVPDQKVPKNIKLPQRKGGMQLWQFLYALLNDSDKKYNKLIEWTANSPSREFRLLEPEAIAIWWGEHKNKKNMSYDKLSRSLRYYYDKGIIRKISGERYVYQFCIDPELMYKHIGNSDSRPKLKPMPQSAHHATSEYQSQHGYSSCGGLMSKDPCFVAQGPLSLGMVHGQLLPGATYPHQAYGGMPFSHGYADMIADLHSTNLQNGAAFYPSSGYDQVAQALPSMAASLGYPHLDSPSPMKVHFPISKPHSFDMPNLTACVPPKYENESTYNQGLLIPSSMTAHNTVLSSQTSLSPPPLTSNTVRSPSFASQGSPLPASYSDHNSPRVYMEDPLGFEEFIPYSSTDYSVSSEGILYSNTCGNSHAHTTMVENSWD